MFGLFGWLKIGAVLAVLAGAWWLVDDYRWRGQEIERQRADKEAAIAANESLVETARQAAEDAAFFDAALRVAQERERALAADLAAKARALEALRAADCVPGDELQRWLDGLRGL